MNISGDTILVTGGTSGIGRALAEALHAKGNKVIITGRRQALLDEVTGLDPGMLGIAVDLSKSSDVARFAESIKNQFPDLNVLFNNAGIAGIEDCTANTIDLTRVYTTIQTNITGVVQLSSCSAAYFACAATIHADRHHFRAGIRPLPAWSGLQRDQGFHAQLARCASRATAEYQR